MVVSDFRQDRLGGFCPLVVVASIGIMCVAGAASRADVVFSQPQSPTGTLVASSWWPPDGTDADQYAWETMLFPSPTTITEIQWQGAGTVSGFTIVINSGMVLPDTPGVLAQYSITGNAGQTPAGIVNGTQRYSYRYTLPTPLNLAANTGYVINIEGAGAWSISQGVGPNGLHTTYFVGGPYFLNGPGDLAITMLGSGAPAISQQPTPVTTCAGSEVTFSVASPSDPPLTYRWRKGTVDLNDDARTTGTGTPTLHIAGVVTGDAGTYSCRVGNANGSVVSGGASLGVSSPPTIIAQPTAQAGCVGVSITLNANATSALPQTVQWRRDGVPITGATRVPYTFTAAASLAGNYDCVFTNSCGSSITNSVPVAVYTPMTITQQPQPASACPGDNASFSVGASSDTPMTYMWEFNGVPISTASNPTASAQTLVVSPVVAGSYGSYSCIVTGSCTSRGTLGAVLSNGTPPSILSQPMPVADCVIRPVSLSVSASGSTSFLYQWQSESPAGSGQYADLVEGPNAGIGTVIGVHGATVEIDPSGAVHTNFRCVVSNGCGDVASDGALLALGPTCDFNQDGAADTGDVLDIADAIASGLDPNPGCKDFNQDGSEDLGDVLDIADAIAAGMCP